MPCWRGGAPPHFEKNVSILIEIILYLYYTIFSVLSEERESYMDTILLLEANEKHADIIRRHLEKHRYHVRVCSSVAEGEILLEKEPPGILLVDLNMSGPPFDDFYHNISRSPRLNSIPRIFISGKAQAASAAKLRDEKGETVLNKPLDINAFIQLLNEKKAAKFPSFTSGDDYLSSFIGQRLGPVLILEEIARGGMGAVFLGHQESLDRQVAVKVLLPRMAEDPDVIARFQREAKAIARLKSPHIVQVYDFAVMENRSFYIVMEYLPGLTLDAFLRRHGKLPLGNAVSIISQTAKGLCEAHGAGLIHRDIKPSNLIMDSKGHVTITDFGLVKPQDKVTATQSGMIFGTPQYISPEQVSGAVLDARADMYSLGIVFYHLIAGSPPFISDNPVELFMKHLKEKLPDPVLPGLPARVMEIIGKMCAKDRDNRYAGCEALLEDLESLETKLTPPPMSTEALPRHDAVSDAAGPPKIDAVAEQGYAALKKHFPTLISLDKLKGSMVLTDSGSVVNQQGTIPDPLKEVLFVLHESAKQLNAAAEMGKWLFTITGTPSQITSLFPHGSNNISMLLFDQKEQSFSSVSFQTKGVDMAAAAAGADPLAKIAAVAGVADALLFNREGGLVQTTIKDTAVLDKYKSRFAPVTQIIGSIPFTFTDIDIWFETGRLLIWKLDSGTLFIQTTPDVAKSFLSLFVLTHLEQLNTSTLSVHMTGAVEKKEKAPQSVANPASPELMKQVQLKLAQIVGPIAKVLMAREIKKMGFSSSVFPEDRLSDLAKILTQRIDADRRRDFVDAVQDVIYEHRSK